MKSSKIVCLITTTLAAAILLFTGSAAAQLLSGLTGMPDTSYTNYSAFTGTQKKYPEIKFPETGNTENIKAKKNIVYGGAGKRLLYLDAFYPKQKTDAAGIAIIIIHGGGWRSGNRTQHHALAQQLAARGYVCFTPEYRLSTEALFPAAVYDLKAVVRWVRDNAAKYNVDTGKIVAAGFSAGGELAALLATTANMPLFSGLYGPSKTPSHVNALVDIDGTLSFVHPESAENNDTSKKISASMYWIGYTQKENYTLWQAASPLNYAGAHTPPTLFLNSSVARMHAGRDDYMKILQQHGIYTELRSFENAPHAFCLFEPWFTPTVNYIDDFLKKVFNPVNKQ